VWRGHSCPRDFSSFRQSNMQVFVCGSELGIGFVVAQRLLDGGHEVTMLTSFEDLIPNLTKNKMNPVLGDVHDAAVLRTDREGRCSDRC
jgi:nucleoside-diphosphate-sugar epimerase